jgi:hypothetical protein
MKRYLKSPALGVALLMVLAVSGCGADPPAPGNAGAEPRQSAAPSPEEAPPQPGEAHRSIPDGPKYVLASGTFDEGEWGEFQGKDWRFVAWGGPDQTCHRLEVGEQDGNDGTTCSTDHDGPSTEAIGARTYDPGLGNIPSITFGYVHRRVERLELRLTTGDVVDVGIIEPPDESGLAVSYYLAFVPFSENGEILAFGDDGELLEKKDLCHDVCGDPAY